MNRVIYALDIPCTITGIILYLIIIRIVESEKIEVGVLSKEIHQ